MKIYKAQKSASTQWKSVDDEMPEAREDVYIVIHEANGTKVRGLAVFQKNGNDEWEFSKGGITHWMKFPDMPEDE